MGDKLEDALGAMKIASAESDGEDDAGERQEELSENVRKIWRCGLKKKKTNARRD
jgi:hypothetical protein